jgi:hypothetical protein
LSWLLLLAKEKKTSSTKRHQKGRKANKSLEIDALEQRAFQLKRYVL